MIKAETRFQCVEKSTEGSYGKWEGREPGERTRPSTENLKI